MFSLVSWKCVFRFQPHVLDKHPCEWTVITFMYFWSPVLFPPQTLTKLEYLDIWGSNVTNQGAVSILNFPNLSFLNLSWTSVTQAPNIPHLECLLMNKCTVVSISSPHSSSVLASLKKLVLSGATFSAETELFSFTSKSSITHLDVSKTSIQDFSFLETMTKLEHLDLSSTAFGDDSVEFVLCVGDTLRNLNVSYTKITYAGVELLSGHVPRLETLSLSQTSIDDLSILCISNRMPCIKALDLSRTSIRGTRISLSILYLNG